jgi:hypothetical protein
MELVQKGMQLVHEVAPSLDQPLHLNFDDKYLDNMKKLFIQVYEPAAAVLTPHSIVDK